ncbi:hypothetical protein TNCV_2419371 [Trichonephila clavipes]|nr:hypothetical protein TNCV_2419371 [Trichonephila clavipes]
MIEYDTLALAPPFPSFHITPTGGRLSFEKFNLHRTPTRRIFSGTRLELMTHHPRVRYLDYKATTALLKHIREQNMSILLAMC